MNKLQGMALLEKLSMAFGPSGCEGEVMHLLLEQVQPYADRIITDALGSLIAVWRGTGDFHEVPGGEIVPKRLLLAAHMDEVGFMINDIDENGYLYITPLGLKNAGMLPARSVSIGTEKGNIPGVIGTKPVHVSPVGAKMDSLYVDIGALSREDAETMVHIGDFGTYRSDFIRFGSRGMIKGKALDDRVGCAILCDILRELSESGERYPYDIYFAFTCRSEIGMNSTRTAAYLTDPDYGILVEAALAADVDGVPENKQCAKVGGGAVISFTDGRTVYDPAFTNHLISTAKMNRVLYQIEAGHGDTGDSKMVMNSRAGVRCASISVPVRYIHSAGSVMQESDYDAVKSLLRAQLRRMHI